MFTFIDDQLNKITMYRLTLYALTFILGGGFVLSLFGIIPYNPFAILFSVAFLIAVSASANWIFSKAFNAPTNIESFYITALILAALISPPTSTTDWSYYALAFWAAVWAMASKYMFAIGRKHIFNPAAFAVVLVAFVLGLYASWWIGTPEMLPFVAIAGFLLVRKIHRADLAISFIVIALLAMLVPVVVSGGNIFTSLLRVIENTPIIFFACIMMTEPLTTPPTRNLRILYGAVTGMLFAPWVHFGNVYSTPELALLAGNLVSYSVGSKVKLFLKLKKVEMIAADTGDYAFDTGKKFSFKAGQYIEWTLPHEDPDDRGVRRYFTIASSPTEKELHLGVKFYDPPSTFKIKLMNMMQNEQIVASQVSGDFILPDNKDKKLVFIAGGIGVTPFRSMIKYLTDMNDRRSVVLIYGNRTAADIAYKEIFDEAEQKIGIRTVYALSDPIGIPEGWVGERGNIDAQMIERNIPDFKQREFYLSGPRGMVVGINKALQNLGVETKNIKTDYFPGFA